MCAVSVCLCAGHCCPEPPWEQSHSAAGLCSRSRLPLTPLFRSKELCFAPQVHLKNECQFEELPCLRADCKEKVLRRDLRDHVEKACKYREATCAHCKSQVPMITLQVRCCLCPSLLARCRDDGPNQESGRGLNSSFHLTLFQSKAVFVLPILIYMINIFHCLD